MDDGGVLEVMDSNMSMGPCDSVSLLRGG